MAPRVQLKLSPFELLYRRPFLYADLMVDLGALGLAQSIIALRQRALQACADTTQACCC